MNHQEHHHLRADHYRFFALSFLRGPKREEISRFLRACSNKGFEEGPSTRSFYDVLARTAALPEEDWNVLCAEYSALFEGTDGRSLSLWESTLSEKGILLNGLTLQVKQFYRRQGIELNRQVHQLEDHIGVECAFLWYLADIASQAGACLEIEAGMNRIEIQRAFLEEHLLPFGEAFCHDLSAQTRSSYWKALAESFLQFLQEDLASLKIGSPLNSAESPSSTSRNDFLMVIFHLLEEQEDEEYPEKKIPISGTNNCGGRCMHFAHIQDGAVLRLAATTWSPAENGESLVSCVRGKGYRKAYLSTSRLRYPMKRVGERGEGRFARISWDEALDEIVERLTETKRRYGPSSRFVNHGSGVTGVLRGDELAQHLLALDGGYLGHYNSYSAACAEIATPYVYGTLATGSTSDTFLDAKLIILWGHNPLETIFGVSTRLDLFRAKKKGVKIIVIDPRYSDSAAAFADQWIGIRPTTDSALIDAMAYVILTEELQDQRFLDTYCLGFDHTHMPQGYEEAENYVDYCLGRSDGKPKTPQWAEEITGVSAYVIVQLAREYALCKPAALVPGLGNQRHGNGEQTVRSMAMLACMTGNVGVRGGCAAGLNQVLQRQKPVAGLAKNPMGLSIPLFLWTDAIVRGTEMTGQDGVKGAKRLPSSVKFIFSLAGNTLINQHSNITKTARILKDTSLCEYIVCSDVFMTPSAKFADLLLPGTSMFETENIHVPWRQGDYLLYNNGAIPPLFEARFEYDWLEEVAARMGLKKEFTKGHETMADWLRTIYEQTREEKEEELPPFEEFSRAGGYLYKNRTSFVAFEKEIRDPKNHPFPTPSGKIEIFSPRLYDIGKPDEIPAIPKYVPSFEGPGDEKRRRYPLQLIGWHSKTRCHSILFSNDRSNEVEEQMLWIHPEDALGRSIHEGDYVTVWNDRASTRLKAHVTERIVRGVVAMAQGAWYCPDSDGVDQNGSINVLTTSRPTPLAKGNPQHSNLVEVGLKSNS